MTDLWLEVHEIQCLQFRAPLIAKGHGSWRISMLLACKLSLAFELNGLVWISKFLPLKFIFFSYSLLLTTFPPFGLPNDILCFEMDILCPGKLLIQLKTFHILSCCNQKIKDVHACIIVHAYEVVLYVFSTSESILIVLYLISPKEGSAQHDANQP